MKKAILLLVTVLAFNLSNAQITDFGITALQNTNSNFVDMIYEIETTDAKNLNLSLGMSVIGGTTNKKFNGGIGYALTDRNIGVTPSFVFGLNTEGANDLFYGLDTDVDLKLLKRLFITAKVRYVKEDSSKFNPVYYLGIKLSL